MGHNLLVFAAAALIPLIVGSLWYSPLLFQKSWLAATGLSPEAPNTSMMVRNMVLLYVFSFFIAFGLAPLVIHQMGLLSLLGDPKDHEMLKDPNSDLHRLMGNLWMTHGHVFRRYRHGALHGGIASITFALPLIATCAIFEKRGVKYVLITWGFWFINFILMGAVVCHWLSVEWPQTGM